MTPGACSRDGFLINQPLLGDEPYGRSNSARSGCGWISAYNILLYAGRPEKPDLLRKELLRRSLFSGLLGTSPFALYRLLKKRFPGLTFRLGRKNARAGASAAPAGVLLYRHGGGLHYAAFYRLPTGRLRFLNAVSGRERDELTMEKFLKTRALWPTVGVYLLPEN